MFALLLLSLAAAAPAPVEPTPPAVTVTRAIHGSIAETAVLTGTLVPREEVLVSPQIEGLAITDILAEEGDLVTAGQVLARLSRDVLDATVAQNAAQVARADAAIAQARSSIAEAQANRVQADLALARTRDLLGNGNASRETFEQRQAAAGTATARFDAAANFLRVAEADRALADAQRRELLVRLARTDLRAPVAGRISRRIARQGAVVAGAGDPLFRIIQDDAVELEADVPEVFLAKLRPGQPAAITTVSGPRTGRVRLVSPEVNRTTRLGRVRVAVAPASDAPASDAPVSNAPASGAPTPGNATGGLVIGSFARALVEVARHDGVLAPLSAVLFQPGGAVVQVVRDGLVETRKVQVGLRGGGQAEIASGLQDGDAVVAISGTFIRGGDRVTAVAAATGARAE